MAMSLHEESCVEVVLLVSGQSCKISIAMPLGRCHRGCMLALLVVRSLFIEARAQTFHFEATVLFPEMMGRWMSLCLTVSLAILFELPCVRATTTTSV